MPVYIVQRSYNRHGRDYLTAWCDKWGTACMGDPRQAMQFTHASDAETAAVRAQTTCRGVDGTAADIVFRAVPYNP